VYGVRPGRGTGQGACALDGRWGQPLFPFFVGCHHRRHGSNSFIAAAGLAGGFADVAQAGGGVVVDGALLDNGTVAVDADYDNLAAAQFTVEAADPPDAGFLQVVEGNQLAQAGHGTIDMAADGQSDAAFLKPGRIDGPLADVGNLEGQVGARADLGETAARLDLFRGINIAQVADLEIGFDDGQPHNQNPLRRSCDPRR